MSAEPALNHAALLHGLQVEYGLTLDRLTFLPNGTAPAYRADGPSGRFFLKVLPPTPYGRAVRERLKLEVPLLRALRESGALLNVPGALPTLAGDPLGEAEGHALALFGWIDGSSLGAAWEDVLPELAPMLGRLHAGTAAVMNRVPRLPVPPEDFALPFEAELRADLEWLEVLTPDARPGLLALRELLLPHQALLQRRLTQARTFQAAARLQSQPFVLCHTDAHGGNVMRDAAGQLWLIDWETARLAPPEHDLWMLHARLPEVLPAYEEARGQGVRLNADVLGFYFTRRVLEDLAVDVGMLRENTRPEEDRANLDVLERFVLPAALNVEAELREVWARLKLR